MAADNRTTLADLNRIRAEQELIGNPVLRVTVPVNPGTAVSTYESVCDVMRRLLGMLEHPEPGLVSWRIAVARLRRELLQELHNG